jgi:hypothetical protein
MKLSFVIERPPWSTFGPSRHKKTRKVQKDLAVRKLHSMPKSPFLSNDSSQWIPPSLTVLLDITYELLSHINERSSSIVSLFKELENIRIDA